MLLSQLGYQMSHLIVTIPIVAFSLKSYDLVPKLAPKGLEIRPVVHVLCMRTVGRTSQKQKNIVYLNMSELLDCPFVRLLSMTTWYALHGITFLSAKTLRQTTRHAYEARFLDTRDGYVT